VRTVTLQLVVKAPDTVDAEIVAKMVDTLIAVGLGEAEASADLADEDQMNDPDAALELDLDPATVVSVVEDPDQYILCKHCDHFVEANDQDSIDRGCAAFIHMEDGEQEFDHAAEPSDQSHTLEEWKQLRPDLFKHHRDGKIGPNSIHHSRRGKIDD
jgi:hypothetical protein